MIDAYGLVAPLVAGGGGSAVLGVGAAGGNSSPGNQGAAIALDNYVKGKVSDLTFIWGMLNALHNSGAKSTSDIGKQCKDNDDGCAKLEAEIKRKMNGLARRFRQLTENKGGIDQSTHFEQLRGRQREMRKLLNKAAAKGCNVPPGAWALATKR